MHAQANGAPPLRVLVVDDLYKFYSEVKRFAALLDCETRLATNLTVASRELEQWTPHIILLDLHLPSDRWEPPPELRHKYEPTQKALAFCQQVTASPRFQDVRVFFVSVDRQARHMELARQAGAHGFLRKSHFTMEVFERLLTRVRAPSSTQPPPPKRPRKRPTPS